jgi:peroxiredoxin
VNIRHAVLYFLAAAQFFLLPLPLPALETGDVAKDFALRNQSGETVTLGHFMNASRLTIVQFVSIYCEACEKHTPHMNHIYTAYQSKGVSVVGVALANTYTEAAPFVKSWGITYPLLADPDTVTLHLYGVHRVPQYFLIDNKGIIRYRGNPSRFEKFEETVSSLLEKQQPVLRPGDPAPPFSLQNRFGDTVAVNFTRRHQNTVLAFFSGDNAANCDQARAIAGAYREYKKAGLRVYGIVSPSFSSNIKSFIDKCDIHFPLLFDREESVFSSYAVTDAPQIVVINETGRIQMRRAKGSYDELTKLFTRAQPEPAPIASSGEAVAFLKKHLPDVSIVKPVSAGKENIYLGMDKKGNKFVARFVKKDILCDVCSDVYFAYTLDKSGVFRHIVPVTPLELYGKEFDAAEFLQQFIGRSYETSFKPGNNVDIISGATKSCMKLIEGLNETKQVFARYLNDTEFDSRFRKNICYLQQAELEHALSQYRHDHPDINIGDIAISDLERYCQDSSLPECPAGGSYTVTIFNAIPRIMCTKHGLDPQSSMIH